jgi:hypothetical protein
MRKDSRFNGAWVFALMIGTCLVSPVIAQHLDDGKKGVVEAAFHDPQSPDVFRALSGLADRPPDKGWQTGDPQEVALMKQLIPDNDAPGGDLWVNEGACRVEQAMATLHDRIAEFGIHSPYVKQWIRVQSAVFDDCSHWHDSQALARKVVLPAPLFTRDRRTAQLQQADRAYQAAAMLFYNNQAAASARAFEIIARSRSPHRYYARYMAIAIRAGTQVDGIFYKPLAPVRRSIAEARALAGAP